MLEGGAEGFWTHDDPALILYGELSTYSAHESPVSLLERIFVQEDDFITVDVAPVVHQGWGDMARSYVMEKGSIIPWEETHDEEIRTGMELELFLHECLLKQVKEDTTFAQLHDLMEEILREHGYHNCDYHGNFGHTIEKDPAERITIAAGVDLSISAYDKPITFEPHICKDNGRYGIKHEDLYFFHEGKLRKLA